MSEHTEHEDEPLDEEQRRAILEAPEYLDAIEAGNKAWGHIKRRTRLIFEDWKVVGRALQEIRRAALTISGANDITSDHYRQQFHALLDGTSFANMDKVVRSKLLDLTDHSDDVSRWWDTLPFDKQARWTHPTTVWKQFQLANKKAVPAGPEVEEGEEEDLDDSEDLEDVIPGSSGKVKIGLDAAANVAAIVAAIDYQMPTTAERNALLKDMATLLRKAAK